MLNIILNLKKKISLMSRLVVHILMLIISFNFCTGQNNVLNEAKYCVWLDVLVNDFIMYHSNIVVLHGVEIIDITKQKIIHKKIESNNNISVDLLKRRLHTLKINNQNQLVQIQKIVLQ